MNYTINRLIKKVRKWKKKTKSNKVLKKHPQKKGVVLNIRIEKPRKPNSAKRKVASIRFNDKTTTTAYIPGEGHNLQEHSIVGVCGAKRNDLTGIHCKVIRGHLGLNGVKNKKKRRSIYGTSKT